ncbi:hypothetical protein [Petrachloros mirabilis]
MSKRIAVVVLNDPMQSHRPVEALRIALGLCAGEHNTTIVLLGKSPLLLTDDIDDVIDVDILEKYRPSFAQLSVPFVVTTNSSDMKFRGEFSVTSKQSHQIRSFIQSVDRTLVFV